MGVQYMEEDDELVKPHPTKWAKTALMVQLLPLLLP